MWDYLFKKFELDTILDYFGTFFKKIGGAWKVRTVSSDRKRAKKKGSVSVANVPALAQGKIISQS